ncbi:hypothetical protein I546_2571 [Mycobacterium kansasii 732]|nr:hypothetical protein [Mycobacterium pseudokansasii]EUA11939.1 hypothetical protein I546_2571 [Mycobacterium kansasii 732]
MGTEGDNFGAQTLPAEVAVVVAIRAQRAAAERMRDIVAYLAAV